MSTGRNFLINLGGNLLGLVLFAALTPLYLHTIGTERYGVVTVILSLSMYVATLNFGMGAALTFQVSGELKDDIAAQSEAFWSAMALSTPIGLVASIVIFGLLPLGLADLMHLTPAVRGELRGAVFPLVGIGLCTILSANARGVYAGRQAFLSLATFTSLDTALAILLPLLTALYVSPSVAALLYATLLARAIMLVAGIVLCMVALFERHVPRARIARIRAMLGYGGWVSLGTLVETVLSSADRLVLGTVAGAGQIAVYSIPLSVTSRAMILPLSLLGSVFPKLVGADAERAQALLSKTVRFFLLVTPGYALVVAFAAPVLRYWIGPAFADQATWALQVLAVALWVEALAAAYFYQLNARGNARANFLIATFVVGPYLALLAAGAWLAGATGIACAYLLRNLLLLATRGYLAQANSADLRAMALNAAPLALAVAVSPHDWASATPLTLALGVGATGLSVAMGLVTRPHDLRDMLVGLLPGRGGDNGRAQPEAAR